VNNSDGTAVTAATEWAYNMTSTDGTEFSNGTTTSPTQYVFFDASGDFINTSGSAAGTTVHEADADPSLTTGDQLQVTKWGTGNNAAADPTPGAIGLDFSKMFAQSGASSVLPGQQNGSVPGTLSNISVGADGTITGAFTNGTSQTLARVAVATFPNEEGLTRIGANQYTTSADSGSAVVGTANSGSFGAIVSDSLEMSNVSISDEFTKLITAQNAFSANSKSITTANEDLQTVIGLIH
jgi:flagellar hook protein FlgE